MLGKKLFCFVLVLSVALAALFSRSHVSAGSEKITRGDVEATLRNWNTGLRALRFIANAVAAAPLEGHNRGLIHAFGSDGAHFCVEDWHVIMTAWVSADESWTRQQAIADLSLVSTFILDGVSIPIAETPVVRRVAPLFFKDEYGFALGSILSPEDLAVGEHTLTYLFTFPDGFSDSNTITFFVDASGTGACVP